jgi:hypothetical protein
MEPAPDDGIPPAPGMWPWLIALVLNTVRHRDAHARVVSFLQL